MVLRRENPAKEIFFKRLGKNSALCLDGCIQDFVETSSTNSLGPDTDEKVFDAPLVGFASGADTLWEFYRSHIGDFYLTPLDFITNHFLDFTGTSEELTVISWILPSTTKIRKEQAQQKKFPAERWARTRLYGEECNSALRKHVVAALQKAGIAALAPMLSPLWSRFDEGPYAPCSNWSERHAAYTCGLGTFGLCDGLITPVGKAVRVGSVIACIKIEPSVRPYTTHQQYCLHFSQGECRACIERCPVGAISDKGHDKQKCMQYTEGRMPAYIKAKFGLETYACGLCQSEVPCTYGIPDHP